MCGRDSELPRLGGVGSSRTLRGVCSLEASQLRLVCVAGWYVGVTNNDDEKNTNKQGREDSTAGW